MTDEEIAKGLTKAQREALIKCTPWDVCVGAGIAIAFWAKDMAKTHRQRRCSGCGLYVIWEPKEQSHD